MVFKRGNSGDELLGILEFWRGRTGIGKNVKSLNLGLDQSRSKANCGSFFSVIKTVFRR